MISQQMLSMSQLLLFFSMVIISIDASLKVESIYKPPGCHKVIQSRYNDEISVAYTAKIDASSKYGVKGQVFESYEINYPHRSQERQLVSKKRSPRMVQTVEQG